MNRLLLILRKKLGDKEIKTVVKNFLSLSTFNVLKFIFPLILIPYLTSNLGLRHYGQYVLSFSIFQYGLLLVNFGFDYSATKLISLNRDNKTKIAQIVTNVTVARLLFAIISSSTIYLVISLMPTLTDNNLLYIYGFGILLGQAITPLWLFQGIEKMGYITIINLITRIISTLLIFIFIHKPSDFYLVNLFQSIGYLSSGIASVILIVKHLKLKIVKPTLRNISFYIADSWQIFLSTLSMSFYREANVIILGITTNYEIVGQYAAIEKIIKAIQSFMDPLSKALFPFFGRKLNEPNESNSSYVKFGKIFTLILVIILSLLYLFGPKLLIWYLGKSFESAIVLFQIMIPVVLFGGLNYYFGIIGLVNLGLNKYFTKAVFITGISSVTLCYLLSSNIGATGAAITMSISELILLSLILRKISPWIKKKTRIEV